MSLKANKDMPLLEVKGSRKTLPTGAIATKYVGTKLDGKESKPISRLVGTAESAARARAGKRQPITLEQAQKAFDLFYKRTRTVKRGPKAGKPRFATDQGRRAARTYDFNTTLKPERVITDSRYLSHSGPFRYDFAGVDTGSKPRKVATAKQLATLTAARTKLASKLASKRPNQVAGYWW